MELSPENQGANNLKLIIFSSEGKTPLFSDFFFVLVYQGVLDAYIKEALCIFVGIMPSQRYASSSSPMIS